MQWSPIALLAAPTSNSKKHTPALEDVGFHVITASSGEEALIMMRSHAPECVVIDATLADVAATVADIRDLTDAYLLALCDQDDPELAATLLGLGADAFLLEPVHDLLLTASLQVARRHAARQRSPMHMDARRYGDLLINFSQGRVHKGESNLNLTSTEFRLLRALVTRSEQTVSHDELLTRVWGTDTSDRTHYVRIYINRLRKKLEDDPSNPEYILTDLGEGYRFNARFEADAP